MAKLTNRIDIECTISMCNEKLGHQTERGGQLLSLEFVLNLGHYGVGSGTSLVLKKTFNFQEKSTDVSRYFITVRQYNREVASVQVNDDISYRFKNTKMMMSLRMGKKDL